MKKLILLLSTIFLCLSLAAQDTVDPSLDLGDVIIEGESDLIKDSLGTNYDLDSLLKINNKEMFLYRPEPVLEASSDHDAFISNNILSLEAKGGNYYFGSLKAATSFSPIMNLNFSLYNRSLKKDWNTFESSANWIPHYKEFHFNAGVEALQYDSEITKTEINDLNFGIQRINSSSREKINLPEFSVYGRYYQIRQDKTELNAVDIRSNLKWGISILSLDMNLEYLKENFQGDCKIYIKELPINRLGLYLHYKPALYDESGKIMVSIDFFNRITLMKSFFLNISNEPFQTKNSYIDDIKKDHYQEPVHNSNQLYTLINPEFSLEYFGPVYVKGSFRFSIIDDYYFFLPDSTEIYKPLSYHDLDRQELGFDISYKYGDIEIGNNLKYTKYTIKAKFETLEYNDFEENVPFMPEINNSTHLELSYLLWKFKVENNYIAGREDELGENMPDVNLLNTSLSYQLLNNFSITGEVENILNEKYIISSHLPEEGFQLKIGFRWSY